MFLGGTIVGSVGESWEDLSEFWRDGISGITVWIDDRTREDRVMDLATYTARQLG
jgi:hypothetical protein